MLPDDVHREIFFRLPARHLCRARAVCRSWRDLASDPTFLRAHAARAAAAPLLLTWSDTVTERDGVRDCTVHLRIHQDQDAGGRYESAGDDGHGRGGSRCCDLLLVLTARYASTSGAMRSWDGILCAEMWVRLPAFAEHVPSSYLLLNPITRACAIASAPALRGSGGGGSDRGYIAGAYSHPVTGVFHLLHSSGSANEQAPRFRAAVGRLRFQSSATAHGRLHWRVAARSSSETNRRRHGKEVELLVFDARTEEFGRMALPELHHHEAVKQRAISALSGKLCLLAGLASPPAAVEVWVLEDYDARDWRLRHVVLVHVAAPWHSPLHDAHCLDSVRLANVGLLVRGDQVEEIILYNCFDKVYHVRPAGSWYGSRPRLRRPSGLGKGLAVHEQSLLPHNVIFGAMPRVQGIAFLDCPYNDGQSRCSYNAFTCY
ncbi:unnamed protein product [Urochloa decumbens]|uniref:F-box domain-containing protein n=1 Tax=Urochloa decumbens TaxID=240449 RepID=A0ABC8XRI8_9POAL